MKLSFKQFLEQDIKSWLLDRKATKKPSIIPPVNLSPEQLLNDLESAEKSQDKEAVAKAKDAIERRGYIIKWKRDIVSKRAAR